MTILNKNIEEFSYYSTVILYPHLNKKINHGTLKYSTRTILVGMIKVWAGIRTGCLASVSSPIVSTTISMLPFTKSRLKSTV